MRLKYEDLTVSSISSISRRHVTDFACEFPLKCYFDMEKKKEKLEV